MTLDTTKASNPRFEAMLPPALFSGASQLGVSFWVRFAGRQNDNGMLFGSLENEGKDTNLFNLNYSSQTRFLFRVALRSPDGKRVYAQVVTSPNAQPGAWNHWWFAYNGARLWAYLNGVLDVSVSCTGLPLWTPAADYALRLQGNATAEWTDVGEIAVWRDTLPSLADMSAYRRGGALPAGAVLRYRNTSETDIVLEEWLEEDGPYDLFVKTRGGILTSEVAGVSPSIQVVPGSVCVLPSGQQVEVKFQTLGGGTKFEATKADGIDPSCSIRRKGDAVYCVAIPLVHRTFEGNTVRWVLPKEVQPTSDFDELFVVFPEGLIQPNEAQFSEADSDYPQNAFGHERYPLPPTPRAKLVAQAPALVYWNPQYTLNDMARLGGAWRDSTTFDNRGIPVSCPNHKSAFTHMSLYAWEGGSPTGDIYVYWRGTESAEVSLSESTLRGDSGSEIVSLRGKKWRTRRYRLPGKAVSVMVKTDAAGNTGLTDLVILKPEHVNDYAAGREMTPEFLETYQPIAIKRWMDAMFTIPGNVATIDHVVPENWKSTTRPIEVSAKILAVEPYVDPVGYFPGNCSTFLVKTDGPHGLHSGQYVRLRKVGTISTLAANACIRTDHLPPDQVECRVSTTSFDPMPFVGGTVNVTVQCLPHPSVVAAMHNELYEKFGRCKVCWVNRPPAATDELWSWYLSELDKQLYLDIEIHTEEANETYGFTTEWIARKYIGEGIRLGLNPDQFYAAATYHNWELQQECIVSGRKHGVICAAQTVNPSMLDARMTALMALGKPNVVMAVTTYHEQPPIDGPNRDGLLALGSEGVAENYDWGLRDYEALYGGFRAKFPGVRIWGYEGGPIIQTPQGDVELFRALTAAAFVHEAARQTIHNFTLAQEAGFDAVCLLPLRGRFTEKPPKAWACAIGYNQDPGPDNDPAAVEQYRIDGFGLSEFASVRLWAAFAWAADSRGALEYVMTARTLENGEIEGPSRPTIGEAAAAMMIQLEGG